MEVKSYYITDTNNFKTAWNNKEYSDIATIQLSGSKNDLNNTPINYYYDGTIFFNNSIEKNEIETRIIAEIEFKISILVLGDTQENMTMNNKIIRLQLESEEKDHFHIRLLLISSLDNNLRSHMTESLLSYFDPTLTYPQV